MQQASNINFFTLVELAKKTNLERDLLKNSFFSKYILYFFHPLTGLATNMSELSLTSKTRPSRLYYDKSKKEYYVIEHGIRKIVKVPNKFKGSLKKAQNYILDKIVGKMNLRPNQKERRPNANTNIKRPT